MRVQVQQPPVLHVQALGGRLLVVNLPHEVDQLGLLLWGAAERVCVCASTRASPHIDRCVTETCMLTLLHTH